MHIFGPPHGCFGIKRPVSRVRTYADGHRCAVTTTSIQIKVFMTDPKFVAFSTQKGGAGKTTLTVLVASYLYYVKGLKILVVDCDYPQFSIEEMRQRDKDLIECSPRFKKQFSDNLRQTKLAPYPLLTAKPEEAMQKVRRIIEAGNEIDIVFFDLPGTVNNRGVVNILNCMDTVIVPVAADKVILESSLAFALKI